MNAEQKRDFYRQDLELISGPCILQNYIYIFADGEKNWDIIKNRFVTNVAIFHEEVKRYKSQYILCENYYNSHYTWGQACNMELNDKSVKLTYAAINLQVVKIPSLTNDEMTDAWKGRLRVSNKLNRKASNYLRNWPNFDMFIAGRTDFILQLDSKIYVLNKDWENLKALYSVNVRGNLDDVAKDVFAISSSVKYIRKKNRNFFPDMVSIKTCVTAIRTLLDKLFEAKTAFENELKRLCLDHILTHEESTEEEDLNM